MSGKCAVAGLAWGQVEAMKWLAIIAMVIDHIDAYLFGRGLFGWHAVGRVAFPLFAVTLAIGVFGSLRDDVVRRVVVRLMLAGAVAQPLSMWLREDAVLNIMFTLTAGTIGAWALLRVTGWRQFVLVVLSLLMAMPCEFGLYGWAVVVACAVAVNVRSIALALVPAAVWSLCYVNGSHAALLSLPLILMAFWFPSVPRLKGFGYWFYPAHLLFIAIVARSL